MSTLGLYFHTVRHLRPKQIAARLWFQLHRPRADARGAPGLRSMPGPYVKAISPAATLVAPQTFRFLNLERRCATAADWHPGDADKLWIYNLHYFDDLNAEAAASRSSWHEILLARWVAENPPGYGDAWEPYPTSRRIVNWVKWAARGHVLPTQCRDSLAVQARWLMRRLEYHLLGNHLFANAKALLHAGLFFDGAEAERWRAKGLAIIAHELREQVLTDGGHFELSTMYHAAVLEDLLDLINLHGAYGLPPAEGWVIAATGMQRWLRVMSHPDGDIAFFNDSAFGVAATGAGLEAYRVRLGLPIPEFPPEAVVTLGASGYVRLRAGPAYLLCDCGPVGPDYLPGHAHADTLSFELSVFGRRVFVNSGTSQYGLAAQRQRERGTAAHNTVVVDGQDSSEVWGGFRVARRARTTLHTVQSSAPAIVEASHDGYCRLAGRNEHRRRWTLDDDSLCIEDRVSGEFRSAEAFFHLHPSIQAEVCDGGAVKLSCADAGVVRVTFDDATSVEIRVDSWHPGFGMAVDNRCIVARFGTTSLTTHISWARRS